jgi:hypothetical protein
LFCLFNLKFLNLIDKKKGQNKKIERNPRKREKEKNSLLLLRHENIRHFSQAIRMANRRAALACVRAEGILDELVALGAPRRMVQRALLHDVNVVLHVVLVRRYGAHGVSVKIFLALLVTTHEAVIALEHARLILAQGD